VSTDTQLDPILVGDDLLEAYLRYFDTQYWLREPELMKERRDLFQRTGRLLADVILEPVLSYDSNVDFNKLASNLNLDPEVANIVGKALFGRYTADGEPILLRKHVADAVNAFFSPSGPNNVVVTSGTGSGKTESFLLPILLILTKALSN
jgi:DEAD/DEAH box helicase domain-containing protein